MNTLSPIDMMQNIATEITENSSLLEVIFRISEMEPETDNALACLIRSMQKTLDTANEYIGMLGGPSAPPPAGQRRSGY